MFDGRQRTENIVVACFKVVNWYSLKVVSKSKKLESNPWKDLKWIFAYTEATESRSVNSLYISFEPLLFPFQHNLPISSSSHLAIQSTRMFVVTVT